MPSDKAIAEFKEIWLRLYGKEITDEEAREQATRLLALYRIVYQTDKRVAKGI